MEKTPAQGRLVSETSLRRGPGADGENGARGGRRAHAEPRERAHAAGEAPELEVGEERREADPEVARDRPAAADECAADEEAAAREHDAETEPDDDDGERRQQDVAHASDRMLADRGRPMAARPARRRGRDALER